MLSTNGLQSNELQSNGLQSNNATYETHNNGGRSFRVKIIGHHVQVWWLSYDATANDFLEAEQFDFYAQHIMIGQSPKNKDTLFSGGFGPEFDGNSILLHIQDNQYVFIGTKIFAFEALNTINRFVSPVGNNDVPYPYACDVLNNIYLMTENIVLLNNPNIDCLIRAEKMNSVIYDACLDYDDLDNRDNNSETDDETHDSETDDEIDEPYEYYYQNQSIKDDCTSTGTFSEENSCGKKLSHFTLFKNKKVIKEDD
jgi:hypothetical protein